MGGAEYVPRQSLVDLSLTPYYHMVGRCVRRAFLCGADSYSGRDYSHRKSWAVDLLARLAAGFSIEVAAYAVMSNHYHLVLRVNSERAATWSEAEVLARWRRFFGSHPLVDRYFSAAASTAAEQAAAQAILARWRDRLSSLSWFMRVFNETLARRANVEDACSGRFWEGRFHSQALLDEVGLLACMAYVDLNPLRAGIATTPEVSEFTSIEQRIQSLLAMQKARDLETAASAASPPTMLVEPVSRPKLMPFMPEGPAATAASAQVSNGESLLPYQLQDYLELLDWAGRVERPGKRGAVAADAPGILTRLGVEPEQFRAGLQNRFSFRGSVVASHTSAKDAAARTGRKFFRGVLIGPAKLQGNNGLSCPS